MRPVNLGIVIVSWNVASLLDACLASLQNTFSTINTHSLSIPAVIVVDNASSDHSVSIVNRKYPWVKLDPSKKNLGYVAANNRGIKILLRDQSPVDYIWLLNPDTIVHATTIDILIDFMQTHPKAGIIGPQLLNPDGSLQESAFRFPGLLQPLFDFGLLPQRLYYTQVNGRYPLRKFEMQKPFRIDHPLGAGMMVRVKAIEEAGLLDEKFFMYCEEIDWAWRMKKLGWESWLIPAAKLTHYGGASTKQIKPQTTAYLWESRARLYRKHRSNIIYHLIGLLTKCYFKKQKAASADWQSAYQRIINAWDNITTD